MPKKLKGNKTMSASDQAAQDGAIAPFKPYYPPSYPPIRDGYEFVPYTGKPEDLPAALVYYTVGDEPQTPNDSSAQMGIELYWNIKTDRELVYEFQSPEIAANPKNGSNGWRELPESDRHRLVIALEDDTKNGIAAGDFLGRIVYTGKKVVKKSGISLAAALDAV